ncbi:helix-turn-helix domain-containing protein [Actinoplanes philippinensis]|uniref:helix-turn-helix domain-containing protein n=1 Tax=Actinoplanes philippinensis TaxID=35752 RepID=UPI0034036359
MSGLPDPEQAAVSNRTFGCVRLVRNKTLAERHAAFFQRGPRTRDHPLPPTSRSWR